MIQLWYSTKGRNPDMNRGRALRGLMMDEKFEKLTKKKEKVDTYRPLPRELEQNLEEWLDVDLT